MVCAQNASESAHEPWHFNAAAPRPAHLTCSTTIQMTYHLSHCGELSGFAWYNEPPAWGFDHEGLFIQPAAATDFWQRTHYGFSADNGHFFFTRLVGDFMVSATVRSKPRHQYDQAGLMVRRDAECWIKTSAEFEPESDDRLGVVVTHHGYSDWSTQDLTAEVNNISFRVARTGSEFIISARFAEADWTQLRMVRLACHPTEPLAIGPYACSPKGAGFRSVFTEISVDQLSNANP
jgi:regulation of enolase protein 1 (concanavalin A-like superfamily)